MADKVAATAPVPTREQQITYGRSRISLIDQALKDMPLNDRNRISLLREKSDVERQIREIERGD